ncbi:MAG: cytochrome c maturation protein CcmE [Pseudomonadales bacterium]|nr:cytochrome c maturation protein CcmE [Pseudomonadales bacterium]
MHPLRKQRLYIVIFIVAGASIAAALAFWALQDNMNFFYAPVQVERGEAPLGKTIRVGGLVVPGSLKRSDSGLELTFTVTDNQADMDIEYQGILPDLFAEGQGIVAVGELREGNRFRAAQVLAKHDENYMPPEVHDALKAGESLDAATATGARDGG